MPDKSSMMLGNPDFWESGNPDFWKSGNPDFWDLEIQKFGVQKMKKIKILKIKIRSAQNVGKAWISRKKIILALFGAIWGHFFHGPKKSTKCQNFAYFSLVGPWCDLGPGSRMGPWSSTWLETRSSTKLKTNQSTWIDKTRREETRQDRSHEARQNQTRTD